MNRNLDLEKLKKYVVYTENLSKHYENGVKVEALKKVNLAIRKGELVAITGPSGSGKSTLLNMLGGLDKPTAGKVYIDGVELSALKGNEIAKLRNRKIGFIFQFHNLLPEFTALENVKIPLILAKVPKKEAEKRAEDLLSKVGLAHRLHHRPSELSGGQNQRVAIARALANNPSIIIGDEPTGNNDTETSKKIFELFKELNKETDQTFVLVTHDLDLAKKTERIINLVDGEIS